MPAKPEDRAGTYRLRLTLDYLEPPIWRLVEVPGATTLDKLHLMFQMAMGWQNCHLHMFETPDRSYGPIDPDDPWSEDIGDERQVSLAQIAAEEGASFVYVYDMGDDWAHKVDVEAINAAEPKTRHAVCLDGARSCPPEDCGGPFGYEEFLMAIIDPDHPDHDDMFDWIGGSFDSEAFDIAAVNRALRKVR